MFRKLYHRTGRNPNADRAGAAFSAWPLAHAHDSYSLFTSALLILFPLRGVATLLHPRGRVAATEQVGLSLRVAVAAGGASGCDDTWAEPRAEDASHRFAFAPASFRFRTTIRTRAGCLWPRRRNLARLAQRMDDRASDSCDLAGRRDASRETARTRNRAELRAQVRMCANFKVTILH